MMRPALKIFHPIAIIIEIVLFLDSAWAASASRMVINEVYYDHPGNDGGWEFVELLNTGAEAAAVSDLSLQFIDGGTGAARVLWTAASQAVIEGGGYLVIAGYERIPGEGLLLRGNIGNGPDAVALLAAGEIIDLVGFGDIADLSLCESQPAPDTEPGQSLSRRPDGRDTGVNSEDFVISEPTPGLPNYYTRDVSVSLRESSGLFCPGDDVIFEVEITNRGIENACGTAVIKTFLRPGGLTGNTSTAIMLEPGSSYSLILDAGLLTGEQGAFSAEISFPGDLNALNDTCAGVVSVSPGDVIVNEIMYRPAAGTPEWIELYNRSAVVVDLASWEIADATGRKRLISGSALRVTPGGYLVLAEDPSRFISLYIVPVDVQVAPVEGGWPALNDSGQDQPADIISLFDGTGRLKERTAYPDLLSGERGRSIERVAPSCCSLDECGIFHRSVSPAMSTPGACNSSVVEKRAAPSSIIVDPQKFIPSRGGKVVVTGRCGEGEAGYAVTIFGLDGQLVRSICSETGGAASFSCSWDGTDDDGENVRMGLYVCLVEFLGPGGGVCRVEKRCIAVGDSGRHPYSLF